LQRTRLNGVRKEEEKGKDMKNSLRKPECGFTLIETCIYLAVLVIVGTSLMSVVLASSRSASAHDTMANVVERNRTVLQRIEREYRKSVAGTTVLDGTGKTLSFLSTAGFDGAATISGPTVTFTFELAAGESLNGADDNGNGLPDEGDIRRTDSGGGDVVICGDVDVQNSGFTVNDDGVTIAITTYGSMRTGNPFRVTKSLSVFPRN
jgi:type II secretory pathway pseudopilin PulG